MAVGFIVWSGATQVAEAMALLGWRLIPISLYHVVPMTLSAFSWRELIPPEQRLPARTIVWIRWIRESINSLLPVAGVGGDFASVRLAAQRGLPGVSAAASIVVDTTIGIATQFVFVLAGVSLLLARSNDGSAMEATSALATGLVAFAALTAAFVVAQHRNLFGAFSKFARRFAPKEWFAAGPSGGAAAIDVAVVATYRRPTALLAAAAVRLAGWAAGAGEIWFAMQALERPLSLADAFMLEGLNSGVRAAAFMAPGALGAQEAGLVVFGALVGIPADIAVTLSLTKRVRELLLGLPGLAAWQWAEGRRLVPRGGQAGV